MRISRVVCGGILFAAFAAAQSPALRDYKTVTAERLTKPDDGDWTMIRRTYDGWGYSPLTQITTDNVQRLQPAWIFATGVTSGHEAASAGKQRRDVRGYAREPGAGD